MTLLDRLDRIMQESWMKDLVGEAYRPNFWSIIEYGRGSYEIRYSRMLRWLMDPAENHGLGPYFARRLAHLAASRGDDELLAGELEGSWDRDYERSPGDCALTEALAKAKRNGGIDVLYSEQQLDLCIAVENKMYAGEGAGVDGGSQLETYYRALNGSSFGAHARKVFVFLTSDGRDPVEIESLGGADAEYYRAWTPLKYGDLIPLLNDVFVRLGNCAAAAPADLVRADHARKIVQDFIVDVQKKFQLDDHSEKMRGFEADRAQIAALLLGLGLLSPDDQRAGDVQPADNAAIAAFAGRFRDRATDAKRALELVHEGIATGTQNHNRNPKGQKIIRMIFNALTDEPHHFAVQGSPRFGGDPKARRVAPIVEPRFRELGFTEVFLTQGKGQGLHLRMGETGVFVYLSVDIHGNLPNDKASFICYDSAANPWAGRYHAAPLLPRPLINVNGCDMADETAFAQHRDRFMDELLRRLSERRDDDAELRRVALAGTAGG